MAEYIERGALETALNHRLNFLMAENGEYDHYTSGFDEAVTTVENFPTANVAPVRHGRWERIGIKGRKGLPIYPCCSVCGMVSAAYRSEWEGLRGAWKYCPNCGAKMDLEEA